MVSRLAEEGIAEPMLGTMECLPEVTDLLDLLLREQKAVLGDNLLAVWLRGSLVTGDFDPDTSDVDVFCVVKEPVTAAEFEALRRMHADLAQRPERYARELELAYVPLVSARHWRAGEIHPTLGRGEPLACKEHGGNWLLERAMLLEAGSGTEKTLFGPPPDECLDPVSAAEIRAAIWQRLGDWRRFALTPGDPAWQSGRGHAAYCMETMCRALYTLRTGKLGSKPVAVAWASQHWPQPWRALVAGIPAWKTDSTVDGELNRRAQQLILWATDEAAQDQLGLEESQR